MFYGTSALSDPSRWQYCPFYFCRSNFCDCLVAAASQINWCCFCFFSLQRNRGGKFWNKYWSHLWQHIHLHLQLEHVMRCTALSEGATISDGPASDMQVCLCVDYLFFVSYHIQSHLKYAWGISVSLSFAQFFPVLHTMTISLLFIICISLLDLQLFFFFFFNCVCSVFACISVVWIRRPDNVLRGGTLLSYESILVSWWLFATINGKWTKGQAWLWLCRDLLFYPADEPAAVPKTGGRWRLKD